MHILIDIGNSTIVVALVDHDGNISHTWRFKTRKEETVTFFRYELKQRFRKYSVESADVSSVVISSVVPEVNDDVTQAINDLTGVTPHFFSIADAEGLLTIDIESPAQLGKDRLADALGAVTCYRVPAIVIDPACPKHELRQGGKLCDLCPTMLKLMGMPQPKEMTGESLF